MRKEQSQHWIARVTKTDNRIDIVSAYYDGTREDAKQYFKELEYISKYYNRVNYIVTMQANPVVLADSGIEL